MNGFKSFLGLFNTVAISALIGLYVERTIGFDNLVPYIQSLFVSEKDGKPRTESLKSRQDPVPENATIPDQTAFDEVILPDDQGNWQGTGGCDYEDYYFSTNPEITTEEVREFFIGRNDEELMNEFLGEIKTVTEQNSYWNRCRLLYENVGVAARARAAMIPQLEMAEYRNTMEVSHLFVNDCIWPLQDAVTVAEMTASGRVVAPVGISGIQMTRSKNHVVLTFYLVEPSETFVYVDEVLEYRYENNLLLSSSQRLDNASQGYLACLSLIKERLQEEALSEGLLDATMSNTEDYIRELQEIRIGDMRMDVFVNWSSGIEQISDAPGAVITEFTEPQGADAHVRNSSATQSYRW